ncbi:cellulose biosynthesis cyclic di-GMP-binding regulatory protein BcsB [Paracoccus laeviglucosivorans]|uniref:Cyclic di-GMP-binding protein n=1 Tax=Paracoccus laeviglucosivorans TaxID=1197861 RepID=A0A521D2E9_9RHOB|nr:cellulose biosynthesis cyclic di-GMP-binding regulatory protein BcsB [Paracoccus laeviglucosivorans]SMO65869.1 cellulose synthase subunit [Paracoccus laeviglucosivorans]
MNKTTRLTLLGLPFLLLSGTAMAQDIVLPPAAAPEAQPAPEAPPVGQSIDAAPAPRDGMPEAPAPEIRQSLLKLRPLTTLPEEVRMGPSLPQPGILRLTGEVARTDLGLDLPPDQALPESLQLSLRSAINVLPDTAVMQITVNDAAPVDMPLNSFNGFKTVNVPTEGLIAGQNRIAISLRQPHRIYCGPDASFGVWTELDLTRSGAQIDQSNLPPTAQGFALALSQQVGSGLPVTVLSGDDTDPAILRQMTDALGTAMQGRGWIDMRSPYDIAARQGPSVALLPSDRDQISYRLDGRGTPTMVVEYQGDALPDFSLAMQELTFPAQAQAQMLQPGVAQTLAQLGQSDIVGNTHYFRKDVEFRLPDDWLLLANQKARLNLQYGYAENLPQGSILLVKINDETVRLLPLDREGGKLLDPLAVGFGARLLHSGVNTLSFEMMVPGNPPDVACPPRQTDMLVVTKESSLLVPHSPAMQLGGFSSALSGLSAAGIKADPAAAERSRMEMAAIQLAAGLRPSPEPDAAVSLTLMDFSTLPTSLADVSLRELQEALFPTVAMPAASAQAAPPPAAPQAPSFRLSETAETPAPTAEVAAPARSWSPLAWLHRQRERLEKAAFLSSGEGLSQWLDGRRGDALLITLDRSQPEALGLILGPDAQTRGISRALDELRSNRLGQGAVALLSNDGSWEIWSPVETPRLQERVTVMNLFPILGNLASWSPFLFATMLLVLGLISVVPALAIVIIFRKSRLR